MGLYEFIFCVGALCGPKPLPQDWVDILEPDFISMDCDGKWQIYDWWGD